MEDYLNRVRKSGSKITSARKAVLLHLYESEIPLTLKQIHNKCKDVDFASVYRSVTLFNSIGLVEEIIFADKKIRYSFRYESK